MAANINYKKCSASEGIFKLDTVEDVENFLLDALTPQEKNVLDMRWHIAQLLHMGEFSYAEIAKQLNTSTTTVTRVARFVKSGNNGYEQALKKLNKNK